MLCGEIPPEDLESQLGSHFQGAFADWAKVSVVNLRDATNDEPGNSGDVEDELYERFLCALRILSGGLSVCRASCDADLCIDHPLQRTIVIRALVDLYPGLRIGEAIAAFEAHHAIENLTGERLRRFEVLEMCLEAGYRPPFAPRVLVNCGTVDADSGKRHIPRRIASEVAQRILSGERTPSAVERKLNTPSSSRVPYRTRDQQRAIENGERARVSVDARERLADAVKRRSLTPWPEYLFDPTLRFHLLRLAASRAYRRAYGAFFAQPGMAARQMTIDARERIREQTPR
jgi:hypothetical protein